MLSLCGKKKSDIDDVDSDMYASLAWCGVHSGNDKFTNRMLDLWETSSDTYCVHWVGKENKPCAYITCSSLLGKSEAFFMGTDDVTKYRLANTIGKKKIMQTLQIKALHDYRRLCDYGHWLQPPRIREQQDICHSLRNSPVENSQKILDSFKTAYPLLLHSKKCAKNAVYQNWAGYRDQGNGPSHLFRIELQNGNGPMHVYRYNDPCSGYHNKYSEPYVSSILAQVQTGDYLEACVTQKAIVLVKRTTLYRLDPITTATGRSQEQSLDLISLDMRARGFTIESISEVNKDDIIEVTYCNKKKDNFLSRRVDVCAMRMIGPTNTPVDTAPTQQLNIPPYTEHFRGVFSAITYTHLYMFAKSIVSVAANNIYSRIPTWLKNKQKVSLTPEDKN